MLLPWAPGCGDGAKTFNSSRCSPSQARHVIRLFNLNYDISFNIAELSKPISILNTVLPPATKTPHWDANKMNTNQVPLSEIPHERPGHRRGRSATAIKSFIASKGHTSKDLKLPSTQVNESSTPYSPFAAPSMAILPPDHPHSGLMVLGEINDTNAQSPPKPEGKPGGQDQRGLYVRTKSAISLRDLVNSRDGKAAEPLNEKASSDPSGSNDDQKKGMKGTKSKSSVENFTKTWNRHQKTRRTPHRQVRQDILHTRPFGLSLQLKPYSSRPRRPKFPLTIATQLPMRLPYTRLQPTRRRNNETSTILPNPLWVRKRDRNPKFWQ